MAKIKNKGFFYNRTTGEKWYSKDSKTRIIDKSLIEKKEETNKVYAKPKTKVMTPKPEMKVYNEEYSRETFINPSKMKIWNMPTKNQLNKIPPLYAQDGKGKEAKVYMKLFTPNKTFYVTEFDKKSGDMFGYVNNASYPDGSEWGYTNFNELKSAVAQSRELTYLARDRNFTPKKVKDIKEIK